MAAGIRVSGLRETIRNLERLGVEVADLKQAFGEISREVATDAGSRVRVATGRLRATIRPSKTKNKAVVRAGGARAPYAGVRNYGWPARGIPGDGFLTEAANARPDEYAARIVRNLDALITRLDLD